MIDISNWTDQEKIQTQPLIFGEQYLILRDKEKGSRLTCQVERHRVREGFFVISPLIRHPKSFNEFDRQKDFVVRLDDWVAVQAEVVLGDSVVYVRVVAIQDIEDTHLFFEYQDAKAWRAQNLN